MKKGFPFLVFTLFFLQAAAQQTNEVNKNESNGLTYMREEEKLARDVYDSMYAKWDVNPFGNIRQSERVHMDKMKTLLNSYGIEDPVMANRDQPGVFKSTTLQKVYHDLVKSGTTSLTDALKAGAKIEELDIADLDERIICTGHNTGYEPKVRPPSFLVTLFPLCYTHVNSTLDTDYWNLPT